MPGTKYRLTYFPVKGRAELIRLIFYAARVPFEDRRITPEEWPSLKPKTPSGCLPMLEINGEKFDESAAIVNWTARKFGLMGRTDAEELKAQALVTQAMNFAEMYTGPLAMEKDPEKIEPLKHKLQGGVDKLFSKWEDQVLQTEANGGKVFSYMVTQSLTAGDLAVFHLAEKVDFFLKQDWSRFPRLQAVLKTVGDLPHLKAYLERRDDLEKLVKPAAPSPRSNPKPTQTPRSQPNATKACTTTTAAAAAAK